MIVLRSKLTGLPVNDLWYNAWAVVPDEQRIAVWERLRDASSTDLISWARGRLIFRQGDINSTRTKPLRTVEEGGHVTEAREPLPTAGGREVAPFGPYTPDGFVDAGADVPAMKLSKAKARDAERKRKERLVRLLELEQAESVCALKDIVGIEPARPMSGALYRRGGPEPLIAFEHTVEIIFPRDPRDSRLVDATFALLMSSVSNFVVALFSTNVHVTKNEIERLPIPDLGDEQVAHLSELARAAQQLGEAYHTLRGQYGVTGDLMSTEPAPATVLERSDIATESLGESVLRGHLGLPVDSSWHISTLLARDRVSFEADPAGPYRRAAELLVADVDLSFADAKDRIRIPAPESAAAFLELVRNTTAELASARRALVDALATVDVAVLRLYGIDDHETWNLVGHGMPWASSGREWADAIAASLPR